MNKNKNELNGLIVDFNNLPILFHFFHHKNSLYFFIFPNCDYSNTFYFYDKTHSIFLDKAIDTKL